MVKWDYIPEVDKREIYILIEEYNDPLFNGRAKSERLAVLKDIFLAYNKYVSADYNLSNMTCASCVKTVTDFFKKEYAKQ